MLQLLERRPHAPAQRLTVRVTTSPSEILDAQRLRWRVFADELGARLDASAPGIDADIFDPFCEHLVVCEEHSGRIVGTYRILSPERAREIGALYADGEFDLVRLRNLRHRMVEVGRSCIDPEFRTGAVITMLWVGLAQYMHTGGYEHLIGCASIGMADGGHYAASVYRALASHRSPVEYRVAPRCPLPLDRLDLMPCPAIPPLIKGYLRLGAYVCGEPAWDPDLNTADLLLLLPMAKLHPRYARHFMERQR
jgi:putative hemolysin